MANKVLFGLKNVHYAPYTPSTGEYGDVKPWPGAVSLAMEPQGDTTTFYADNVPYYVTTSNAGYQGDFESAVIPEDVHINIMKETKDTATGLIVESADAEMGSFALMFEFAGDASATKHCFYNCKMTRPNVEGQTTEESKEVQTQTTQITASPQPDTGYVKTYCEDTTASAYATFYDAVPEI